jgi:hypothetical protein
MLGQLYCWLPRATGGRSLPRNDNNDDECGNDHTKSTHRLLLLSCTRVQHQERSPTVLISRVSCMPEIIISVLYGDSMLVMSIDRSSIRVPKNLMIQYSKVNSWSRKSLWSYRLKACCEKPICDIQTKKKLVMKLFRIYDKISTTNKTIKLKAYKKNTSLLKHDCVLALCFTRSELNRLKEKQV